MLTALGLPVDGNDAWQRRKQRGLQLADGRTLGARRVTKDCKRLAQLDELLRPQPSLKVA